MTADPQLCPDCEQPSDTIPCPSCQQWRDQKFVKMDDEWQDKLARRKRFRPLSAMSGADFGEALADMVKAIERSRQQ
jgi:hypothetical protein